MESLFPNPGAGAAIFLVGFMACGKSTVGPQLGAKLACPFIDLDRVIEAEVGCTIAELIDREGEAAFRRIEADALRAVSRERAVIAPGGGAITRPENRECMRQAGVLIWLDAPFELCWSRILADAVVRPLAPDSRSARERYDARLPLYRQAPLRIEITRDKTPEQIADEILALL
ncbi:MAG: shikimate kinase [Blastocatellia bacterium]|nr:shikimate kinase [Blastocatellia bacterium]